MSWLYYSNQFACLADKRVSVRAYPGCGQGAAGFLRCRQPSIFQPSTLDLLAFWMMRSSVLARMPLRRFTPEEYLALELD